MAARMQKFVDRWRINLAKIGIDQAIDRIFRFLEMIILTTLVGFTLKVVEPELSYWVTLTLSLLCGAYLGIPAARWWLNSCSAPPFPPANRFASMTILSVGFGMTAVSLVLPLQVLIMATMQIDVKAAKEAYYRQHIAQENLSCLRALHSVEQCEERLNRKLR